MARPRKDTPILSFTAPKSTFYNAQDERKMNFIGQRIAEGRYRKGLSQDAFSQQLQKHGVSVHNAAISKWETGDTTPNAYQLLAIWQALNLDEDITFFMSAYSRPKLNPAGLKKVADYQQDLIDTGKYQPERPSADIIYVDQRVSNLTVSAGTGSFLDEGSFELVSVPAHTVPDGTDFGIRVSGDSMEPVYHDGQIVWVKECSEVPVGQVGIFIYDGEGYLKMLDEQEPCEEDREDFIDSYGNTYKQIVMVSFNQKYPPKLIPANASFYIVGRVLN